MRFALKAPTYEKVAQDYAQESDVCIYIIFKRNHALFIIYH